MFSPNSSIFFQILIEVTFWLSNIEKYTLDLKQLSWAKVRKNCKWWRRIGFRKNFDEEELVFETILSVKSILRQFFIQFQFSCVILTDQTFMSFIFHTSSKYLSIPSVGKPASCHWQNFGRSSQSLAVGSCPIMSPRNIAQSMGWVWKT